MFFLLILKLIFVGIINLFINHTGVVNDAPIVASAPITAIPQTPIMQVQYKGQTVNNGEHCVTPAAHTVPNKVQAPVTAAGLVTIPDRISVASKETVIMKAKICCVNLDMDFS